ncbi:hypothetical protein AB205_0041960 [Aquarana catesbeiana]|uniref:Uncharacterized protein n=1 Tax=Aquarana catesbeiana TaxID=8400 RepID=A0A2G9QI50_AQUCT|nr:hypothetical protein AB205_0041960 [Aquarana catesbeiana]
MVHPMGKLLSPGRSSWNLRPSSMMKPKNSQYPTPPPKRNVKSAMEKGRSSVRSVMEMDG